MQVFRSIREIPSHYGPSVVTIGNFDGVHRGHQAVIAQVIRRAEALHARSVAVTFEPHPARVLRPQIPLRLITVLEQKLELFQQTGVDAVLVLPFTHEMSRLTARQFVQSILCDALGAVEVQEGENFRFGVDAEANVNDLVTLGGELGFVARVHEPALWRGIAISSSRVRTAIAEGNMRLARHFLGRPFAIVSTPAAGRGYGTRYTVPTVNLGSYSELLPANGVYVTCLEVGDQTFHSVSNVGNRPTFGADSFAVESHILNFQPLSLDRDTRLRLTFLDRLRGEVPWPSPEALKVQIDRDVAHARHYFGLYAAMNRLKRRTVEVPLR